MHSVKWFIVTFITFSISSQILNVHCQYEDDTEWDPSIPSNPIEQILALLNPSSMNNSSQLTLPQLLQQFQSLFSFIRPFLTSEQFLNSLPKVNLSAQCMNKTVSYINALRSGEEWALRIMDCWGKPGSGIFVGSNAWVGEYSQCLKLSKTIKSWETKYCLINEPMGDVTFPLIPRIKYGVCTSKDCNTADIIELLNSVIVAIIPNMPKDFPLSVKPIDATYVNCNEKKQYSAEAIAVLTFISLLLLIILIATLYDGLSDYIQKHRNDPSKQNYYPEVNGQLKKEEAKGKNVWLEILLTFSALRNAKKIFNINQTSEQFDCLNGIRVLSILWIICGHSYLSAFDIADNGLVVLDWLRRLLFLLVLNSTFAVDTFFTLSGFLLCYIFLKETNKPDGKINFRRMLIYYFHRFWRLSPPYIIVLLWVVHVSKYLGDGPFYPKNGLEYDTCKNNLWANVLYLNNLFDPNKMCLGISWYLANDMQFHWLAPIVLIPWAFKKRIIGTFIALALLIGTILCNALLLNANPGWETGLYSISNPESTMQAFEYIYLKPWCRIGPFVVGLLLGYIIFVQKTYSKYPKIDYRINIVAWILVLGLCALMIFGIHPDYIGNELSRTSRILYQTFSRIVWSIGVGYVIYACITSNGGIVNRILSHPFWIPLSRLTYAVYLVHFSLNRYFLYIMEHPIHLQHSTIFYMFASNFVIAYIVGFLVNIFFEAPFIGLEKFILKKH